MCPNVAGYPDLIAASSQWSIVITFFIAHSCKPFTVLQQCPSNWQSIFFLLELGLQKCILSLRQATKQQRDSLDMRKFNKIFAPSESTWCFDTKIKSNARKEKKFAFKVAVSQDFLAFFLFHESNPSGPLIHRLKWFPFKVRFRGYICKISDSAQANTARNQTLHRLTLCVVRTISFENPKLANTAQNETIFFFFKNLRRQGI